METDCSKIEFDEKRREGLLYLWLGVNKLEENELEELCDLYLVCKKIENYHSLKSLLKYLMKRCEKSDLGDVFEVVKYVSLNFESGLAKRVFVAEFEEDNTKKRKRSKKKRVRHRKVESFDHGITQELFNFFKEQENNIRSNFELVAEFGDILFPLENHMSVNSLTHHPDFKDFKKVNSALFHCLWENKEHSNLSILCEKSGEKVIKVHKEVVLFGSDFLFQEMKHWNEEIEELTEIALPGLLKEDIVVFMEYLYKDSIGTNNIKIVFRLLHFSVKFFETKMKSDFHQKFSKLLCDSNWISIQDLLFQFGYLMNEDEFSKITKDLITSHFKNSTIFGYPIDCFVKTKVQENEMLTGLEDCKQQLKKMDSIVKSNRREAGNVKNRQVSILDTVRGLGSKLECEMEKVKVVEETCKNVVLFQKSNQELKIQNTKLLARCEELESKNENFVKTLDSMTEKCEKMEAERIVFEERLKMLEDFVVCATEEKRREMEKQEKEKKEQERERRKQEEEKRKEKRMKPFGESKILVSTESQKLMMKILNFGNRCRFKLIYRGSLRSGNMSCREFHRKCDRKHHTVTVALHRDIEQRIIGGYTAGSWDGKNVLKYNREDFYFVTNIKGRPYIRFNKKDNRRGSVYCDRTSGPAWCSGGDSALDLLFNGAPNGKNAYVNQNACIGGCEFGGYDDPVGVLNTDISGDLGGFFFISDIEVYHVFFSSEAEPPYE